MRHRTFLMAGIRIFFLVLYLFSFTYGRFFISIFFFILSITDIFLKKAGMVFIDLGIAFLLDTAMNPALELYYQTEKIRFHVLESRYEQAVKETIPLLMNDTEGNVLTAVPAFCATQTSSAEKEVKARRFFLQQEVPVT